MTHRLMLTVDVEAQPQRATEKHVDRLIWGDFPEGRAGIGEMMDIADKHGAKLTMFLDWAETDTHGEAINDVGREIHRRGHDLELHVHTDFFSKDFWIRSGINPEIDLNILSPEQADAIADEIVARQAAATSKPALAFRGGGYRYSANLLNSLRRNGVLLDTSVNVSRPTQPVDLSASRQFRWSNGMIEAPVSSVINYRNSSRPLDFNFNSLNFPDATRMHEYLANFWDERGEDAIAVLVLHSWSLLKLHQDGTFRYDGDRNPTRFDTFLAGLAGKVTFVTAADVIDLDRKGALALDPAVDLTAFPEARQRKNDGSAAREIAYSAPFSVMTTAGYTSLSCPICGAAKNRFVDMNGRKCPDCGSVERQRSLAIAYENGLRKRFDVSGKHVLIFSPSVSELRFLNGQGLAAKLSADIRPAVKPDVVLDMCAMPSIESDSWEFVFASYLMPVVHDMDAALDEVARVLAPGGAFISVEPLLEDGSTREITDRDSQAGWYGTEALDKYKVGSYRTLGKSDYLTALKQRFDVEQFSARDPISGQVNHVHLCWSQKPGSAAPLGIGFGRSERPIPTNASKDELNSAGEALWRDSGNPESQKRAVEIFQRLYDLGDKARAGYRLGTIYYLGRGAPKNLETAYGFLSLPELDRTRYALYYRGLILKDSDFSGRDDARALAILKQAQDLGVAEAAAHIQESRISAPEPTAGAAMPAAPTSILRTVSCTICGCDLSTIPTSEPNCPKCNARPRTRVFATFLAEQVKPLAEKVGGADKPLLAFAMTDAEREILSSCFGAFKSVSLYGNYRADHEQGVDARDLSRYPDGFFRGHFGILLFDYFPEHEKALAEAARVTAAGGLFIHHINTTRLIKGDRAPETASIIQKKPGYFDYVPETAAMPSIRVGIDWFLATMEKAGFDAHHIAMNDRHTGEAVHWFLGVKRATIRRSET